jgi:uncharacterized lipoprotein
MRTMAGCVLFFVCAAAALLAGCSGETELRGEDTSRYATSVSVPPLRIPDDLTVPDESDSLLIPDPDAVETRVATECLETPPSYYEQGDDDQ